jgi:hypothetical protein
VGSAIVYSTTTSNSGAGLTLNVNSLGAKSVAKWQSTTTLAAGDIAANKQVLMTYDGTNWETTTIGNAPSGGGVTLPIMEGGTGATTVAGAWANIFSGAGIASNCALLQNVSGTLTCTATTAAGALANLGGAAISGQAFTGPISAPFYNTIPQADQFAGADMCAKTRAAATYALANGINQVDATHFSGTQACATDMLGAIATFSNSSIYLVVNLGAVHIRSSVAQTITNPGVTLHGMGPMHTQLEYIGVSLIPAVLTVAPPSPSLSVTNTVDQVEGIFIYGDLANATDALLIQATNHSQFRSVWTWGVTNCGIHTEYAVTDSFITPRTSMWSARALLGSTYNTAYTVPSHGLCFDVLAGGGTTNGTVQDAAAEGLTGAGWWLANGSGMTFTSGTMELATYLPIQLPCPSGPCRI